jgi:hypothetical protein
MTGSLGTGMFDFSGMIRIVEPDGDELADAGDKRPVADRPLDQRERPGIDGEPRQTARLEDVACEVADDPAQVANQDPHGPHRQRHPVHLPFALRRRPTAQYMTHMFDMRCEENGIKHRLTKVKDPWTSGQVERMNRTIKEATVKRYHYDSHDQLRQHLTDFVAAYNYARRLKTLCGLTPYEFICKASADQPQRFTLNPHHQSPGPNT